MRRWLVGVFIFGMTGGALALASCVGDVPAGADSGPDSGPDTQLPPDSGPGFCERFKNDKTTIFCADFDDGTLGGLVPLTLGKEKVEVVQSDSTSPPGSAHLGIPAMAAITGARLQKPLTGVMLPTSFSVLLRVKPSASCFPANDNRGVTIAQVGVGMSQIALIATASATQPVYLLSDGTWQRPPMQLAPALAPDAWANLRLDFVLQPMNNAMTVTVNGQTPQAFTVQFLSTTGPVTVVVGPSSAWGAMDGGTLSGYNGPCDMLVDDLLIKSN